MIIKFRRLRRFQKLWVYIKPYWLMMAVASLFAIPLAALNVFSVKMIQILTDDVLAKKSYENLRYFVILLLAVNVGNFVFRFVNNYFIRKAANQVIEKLRNDVYQHLLRLSLGYFNEAQGGVLLSRVVNDVQTIVRAISSIVDGIKEPLTLIGFLVAAFVLNWKLMIYTLVILPLCAVLMANAGKHSKRYQGKILNSLGEMSALLSESIFGMRVIQSFNLEKYLRKRFEQVNGDFTRTALKAIRVEELSRPAVEFVFGLALTLMIFLASREALKGNMSPGQVTAFFTAVILILQPLRKLSDLNVTLTQTAAAIDHVFAILETKPAIEQNSGAPAMAPFKNEIEFRNITFRYKDDLDPVLRNFTLRVKKGEVVALVGASGGGKSTVLSLIPRFFDPESGNVLIDGVNVRDLALSSLRENVALVTQEVFLFHDSVRANMKAGREDVSDAQLQKAAEAAQAWDYISRLPDGLNTTIGDRGQKLSGGERQRLSIARAILKDAPILLLDEATSALDSENERLVQAALDRLMVGRTAIVVAHRLSTIRKANRILVIEKGQVVEEGDHDALLAKGGAYARALSLQESFAR